MAMTPQPTPKPTPPHTPPPAPPAKVEAHAKETPAFTPKPAIDPRAEKPPAGAYADGMTIAEEQRARSAWIEAHGDKAFRDEIDQRTPEEKAPKQVPGVTPPTKRE